MSNNSATDFVPQQFDAAAVYVALHPTEAAEAARALAFEKGFNEGLEKARATVEAATEESNKRVRRTLAALREAIDLFDQRETTAIADVEDAIVAAAFQIATAVVQRELQLTADPGAEAIARALQLVPSRSDVVARLNPDDVATLNVESVPTNSRNLMIVADASVEAGGCMVEAGESNIDSQISAIFANVRTALGLEIDVEPGGSAPQSREMKRSEMERSGIDPGNNPPNTDAAPGSAAPNSRTTASEAPLS